MECTSFGSGRARRAYGLSTLETQPIKCTFNMHIAFALLALLDISVTQKLFTTYTGTRKTPTVPLTLHRDKAMLMDTPFALGARARHPT